MLVTHIPTYIPSKSVITDLALRNGSPTRDSCSPFEGIKEATLKQFSKSENFQTGEIPINFEYYMDKMADFSIQKYNEKEGVKYNKVPGMVYERLEDIHPSDVATFTINQIIGIKINNKNSLKADYYENQVEKQFESPGEDNEGFETSSSLASYSNQISIHREEFAKERIPYLLKHLHEYSKATGYSLISAVIAYDIQINKLINTISKPKPKDILETKKYYPMNPNGTLGEYPFADNAYIAAQGIKWIRGLENDIYYEYARELMVLSEELGTPMRYEDPLEYQEPFFRKLVVTYIEKNRTHLEHMTANKPMNHKVLKRIGEINLDEYMQRIQLKPDDADVDRTNMNDSRLAVFTAQTFEFSQISGYTLSMNDDLDSLIAEFSRSQVKYFKQVGSREHIVDMVRLPSEMKSLSFVTGFYARSVTEMKIFDLTHISGQRRLALLHWSGFFIELRNDHRINLLGIRDAIEYTNAKTEALQCGIKPQDINKDYGKWDEVLV